MNLNRHAAIVTASMILLFGPRSASAQAGDPDFKSPPPGKTEQTKPAREGRDSPSRQHQEVDLRPRFREGQTVRFVMKLESRGRTLSPGATEPDQVMDQEIGFTLRVRSVSSQGNASLDLTYDSLKLNLKTGAVNVNFDSSTPNAKDDDMGELLRPIVGLTLALETDAEGTITSVTSGGPAGDPSGGALMQGLMSQFTGADVVKRAFGPITSIRKGSGRASVGESWTNEDVIDGGMGRMRMKNTYTLRSHSGGIARVQMQGQLDLDGSSMGPVSLTEGTSSGEYEWSTEEGMLRSMSLTYRTRAEQKLTDTPASSAQEMKVSVRRR